MEGRAGGWEQTFSWLPREKEGQENSVFLFIHPSREPLGLHLGFLCCLCGPKPREEGGQVSVEPLGEEAWCVELSLCCPLVVKGV